MTHIFVNPPSTAKLRGIASNVDTDRLRTRPLLMLDYLTELVETAEVLREEYVRAARETGESWQMIASQLGVTKQAAQQRYGCGD